MDDDRSDLNVRDLLQSHWNQLVDNMEAEVIANELYERGVLGNNEVGRVRAENASHDQAKALLTAMEMKNLEEFLVFVKVLTTFQGALLVVGEEILARTEHRLAESDPVKTGAIEEVPRKKKDAACQTVTGETVIMLCLRKMGRRIGVPPTLTFIGMVCVMVACAIQLVYTNIQLRQTVLVLEENHLSLNRNHYHLMHNLTELSRNYNTLKETHDTTVAEKSELAIAVDRLKGNVSALTSIEEEKRTLLQNLTDLEEIARALSQKLSQITKENRQFSRIIPNLRRKLMIVRVRLIDCEESLQQEVSNSSETKEKLRQEKENLARKNRELETKLSLTMQAEKKAIGEIEILRVDLEKLRIDRGERKHHHHHHHQPRHHGKRGKCKRKIR